MKSNTVETVRLPDGEVSFDHSTLTTTAKWDNGYTETWPARGYGYEAKLVSFYYLSEQFDKLDDFYAKARPA